jgi:tetratricopeptide (TPR) repeat protein
MRTLRLAAHRTILIVDVESFGHPDRNNADQVAVRDSMYRALRQSLAATGISWRHCATEDRGDGALILLPATVPKGLLVTSLPGRLAEALDRHNVTCIPQEQIRLRMALHAGEVQQDSHGFTSASLNHAFRLIEADTLKAALRNTRGTIALIVSDWFYEEVVRHHAAAQPSSFRRVRVMVKETDTPAWVRVIAPAGTPASLAAPAYPGRPSPLSPLAVTCSLPPDTAAFTGRGAELDRITAVVAGATGAGSVATVGAIDGMPGVGKTALAVHVAHELSSQFPDRQLFVNLHAHTPGRQPAAPEDALAGLLAAAGVDPRYMPGDLDGRAAMWRDQMAGQQALLLLDNAASSSQVTPLLPGGATSLVLVTSRRHLGDLPGAVTPVLLDVLPEERAAEMFIRLAPRAVADGARVAQVVRLAGFLPLAISLLARVYTRHPSWTLADLADETRDSLLSLKAENDTIAAAFDVSYRHLDPALRRFFDLLGLHPGTTTDRYAAAALAGIGAGEAGGLLDGLHGEGLVTETGHRRYDMHDLLRRYARDHADAAPDQKQALGRLLDYYQHTAAIAQDRLTRQTRSCLPPPTFSAPVAVPAMDDAGQALAWARADRDSLLACLDHVTRTGQHARVIALTTALAELLRRDGPWAEAITRHTVAVDSAQHLSDRPGQADALNGLGIVRWLTGDNQGATANAEQALAIYRDLGDRLGQANALFNLGAMRRMTGDYAGAAGDLEQALAIFRDLGDRFGQANALFNLGDVRRGTGNYQGAAEDLEQALVIYRDLGNRNGQANALLWLGVVERGTGDSLGAAENLEQALAIYRDLGSLSGLANALSNLGGARRETGNYQEAAENLEQALAIFRDLGDRDGQADVLNEKGTMHRVTGAAAEAEACHQQALDLARAIGSAPHEAHALAGLGRCAVTVGRTTRAEALLRQANVIFQRIGAADATFVLTELDALTRQEPHGKR